MENNNLWSHQKKALDFIANKTGAMLAMDMGTGKSRVVVEYIRKTQPINTLIICPLSVIGVWPEQFEKFGNNECPAILALANGSVAKKTRRIKDFFERLGKGVAIVNYESVRSEPLSSWTKYRRWSLVVLDESHKIKTPASVISWWAKSIRNVSLKRLALTGTPLPHSPLDAYAQYRFLNPRVFQPSYALFKNTYGVMGGYREKQVIDFQNMEDFNTRFKSIAYRVSKDEALDLPDEVDVIRKFDLSEKTTKIYKDLERWLITQVQDGVVTVNNALTKLLRLQQITGGSVGGVNEEKKLEVLSHEKAHTLQEIIQELPPKEPVVVFCRFLHDIDEAKAMLMTEEREVAELSGRVKELERFKSGEADSIVVQIQSGGLGVDLSRACYSIFYSMGFSLGDYQQARARIHRAGQNRKVTHIHVIARDTVDEKIMGAIQKKKNIVDFVLTSMKNDV